MPKAYVVLKLTHHLHLSCNTLHRRSYLLFFCYYHRAHRDKETAYRTLHFPSQYPSSRRNSTDPEESASQAIEGDILNNGYGYLKTHYFPMAILSSPEKILKEKLQQFQDNHVKGLIIDLRDNKGGYDQLVANIAGYFVKEERFYEVTSYYNKFTKKFEIYHNETRKIIPTKPSYDGKIAILINSQTISSGEGLPLVLYVSF
ncbi:S41 family peptidase [Paenibacillus sp. OSY-SE]|uniref:S41 family peptidase n=1 Tax=Paenibacillus sp. OSY-SE TaxID=1196323 RepID=UPI003FCC824F